MATWHRGRGGLFLLCVLSLHAVHLLDATELGGDQGATQQLAHSDSLDVHNAIEAAEEAAAGDLPWEGNDALLADGVLEDSLLRKEAESKRRWGDNSMRVWGKRNGDELQREDEKRAWQNNMRVWGKRGGDPAKKKWGNTMRVWGKRDSPLPGDADKRKWTKTMKVWGKRVAGGAGAGALAGEAEQGGSFPLGGPAEAMDDMEKRKWTKSTKVWGKRGRADDVKKRPWQNNMRVWGKRSDGDHLDSLNENDPATSFLDGSDGLEKKAWDKNMRVWGKRSVISKRSVDLDNLEKRAWNSNTMRVWGKRRNRAGYGGPKRSWKTNVMRVWGKRGWPSPLAVSDGLEEDSDDDGGYDDNALAAEKRGWDSNTMRTWGKRSTGLSEEELAAILARYI